MRSVSSIAGTLYELASASRARNGARKARAEFPHDLPCVAHLRLEPRLESEIEGGTPHAVERLASLVAPGEEAAREMRCEERRGGPLGQERLGGRPGQLGVGGVARVAHAGQRSG